VKELTVELPNGEPECGLAMRFKSSINLVALAKNMWIPPSALDPVWSTKELLKLVGSNSSLIVVAR